MMDRRTFTRLLGAGALGFAGSAAFGSATQRAGAVPPDAKNWAWMRGERDSLDAWKRQFAKMRAAGIDAVLLQKEGDALRRLVPAARTEGVEVHAWVPTMMRGEMTEEHPDWYAVNRKGVSTAEEPPLDYYRFLSPCVEGVQQYTVRRMKRLAQIEGLSGVQLDYIRFPDVILPVALQPKYDLDQGNREMARFDYGYHRACRAMFEEQTGTDPMELDDPAGNEEWVQLRYDRITAIVEQGAEVVHAEGKTLSAAVFPTPDIARKLVRQDWDAWPLDAVMPMIYHNFYEKPVSWIETATRRGIRALGGAFPLYSGLFVPELAPEQLPEAVAYARSGGASGITLSSASAMTDRHWRTLETVLAET